jgi:predicted kinase
MKTTNTLKESLIYALSMTDDYYGFYELMDEENNLYGIILNQLENTPQFYGWHPEIDTATHTYYVCKAIFKNSQDSLLEAGFLHDVGKKDATNVGAKKIWHYNHPKKSVQYIKLMKDQLCLEESNYEFTCNIVEHHMDTIENEGNKELKLFQFYDKVRSKEIYLEETTSIERYLNKLDQKWMFFKKRFAKKKLYTMIGISGSGKSKIANEMFSKEHIVSTDAIRKEIAKNVSDQTKNSDVFDKALNTIIHKFSFMDEVVFDATNVNKGRRIEFFGESSYFRYIKKIALVVPCAVEQGFARIQQDIGQGIDRSNVPLKAIQRQYNNYAKGFASLYDEFDEVRVWDKSKQKFVTNIFLTQGLIKSG